jgi:hypothetical protein
VTVQRTLAKVDEDLRAGDVQMARRRLKSLVESLPHRLEARERLADVCRLDGDPVEAGRWSYLGEHRDPAEVAAFERACGDDPVRIMRGLRWPGPDENAATEQAQVRLVEVRARAEAKAGKKLEWADPGRDVDGGWRDAVGPIGCALVVVVLVALVAIGISTVIDWIV